MSFAKSCFKWVSTSSIEQKNFKRINISLSRKINDFYDFYHPFKKHS